MKIESVCAFACLVIAPYAAVAKDGPVHIAMPSWDSVKFVACDLETCHE